MYTKSVWIKFHWVVLILYAQNLTIDSQQQPTQKQHPPSTDRIANPQTRKLPLRPWAVPSWPEKCIRSGVGEVSGHFYVPPNAVAWKPAINSTWPGGRQRAWVFASTAAVCNSLPLWNWNSISAHRSSGRMNQNNNI